MTTSDPSPEAMKLARQCSSRCYRCDGAGVRVDPRLGEITCPICRGDGEGPPEFESIARAIDAAVAEAVAKEWKAQGEAMKAALDPRLVEARIEAGEFHALVEGGTVAQVFAAAWWDLLTDSKADNYVEVRCGKGSKEVVVTCRKANGKTPAQLKQAAEDKLATAVADAFEAGQRDMRDRAEAEARPKVRRGAVTAGLDKVADRISALEIVAARTIREGATKP